MQRHAKIGYDILSGSDLDLLDLAATIAWTHHERVRRDAATRAASPASEIPLEGRIVAVVDVYDALTSDRPYRPGLSHADALALMREGSGTHFDAIVLDAFMTAMKDAEATREGGGRVSEPRITCVIADDHPAVLDSLARVLRKGHQPSSRRCATAMTRCARSRSTSPRSRSSTCACRGSRASASARRIGAGPP